MKLMYKLNLIIVSLLLCFTAAVAQTRVIELWPNGVPDSKYDPSYKVEIGTNKNGAWEKNISDPTLDYYPASVNKASGTAVIICPGGGYSHLAIENEGSKIAQWLNSIGVTAFVLKYRLPDTAIMINKTIGPLQDAQRAMRIVRRHAKQWKIDPNKIGIMGFSAGGHVASTLSTHFNQKVYKPVDSISARPDFSILVYPVISMEAGITHMGSRINLLGKHPSPALVMMYSNELQVNKYTPPAFLVQAMDDPVVPVQNSIDYALALRKYKIPCELHLYEKGGHGFGLGRKNNDTESSWTEACVKWLKMHGFIK
ncbi:MAG: alpha/beta hydrolase [Bacteroidales bacterium]|nr:alpha/beta hydrolase [Bacteroidales bacterium]